MFHLGKEMYQHDSTTFQKAGVAKSTPKVYKRVSFFPPQKRSSFSIYVVLLQCSRKKLPKKSEARDALVNKDNWLPHRPMRQSHNSYYKEVWWHYVVFSASELCMQVSGPETTFVLKINLLISVSIPLPCRLLQFHLSTASLFLLQ